MPPAYQNVYATALYETIFFDRSLPALQIGLVRRGVETFYVTIRTPHKSLAAGGIRGNCSRASGGAHQESKHFFGRGGEIWVGDFVALL